MKVITPGHRYELSNFEEKNQLGQTIQFIHKEPITDGSKELTTLADGTTNEELLEVLIDRMQFLQGNFPCRENAIVITKLEESLMWLNKRTAVEFRRIVNQRARERKTRYMQLQLILSTLLILKNQVNKNNKKSENDTHQ